MKYGFFDETKREYVITKPDTPTPWINYIGSGVYGGIVSNTGGGYSFHKDPKNRRVTRYRYNSIPMDRPGRYIYLRDKATGDYWNPGFQPSQKKLSKYQCRHGMGYTEIEGERNKVFSSVTYFVPDNKDFEIWLVKVRNDSNVKKEFQVFTYAEFSFNDATMDQTNIDWLQQVLKCTHEKGLILFSAHYERFSANFLASGEKESGFETNLAKFIGPYRSEANPLAVETGTCSNTQSPRTNGVGCFRVDVNLAPGAEKEMVFILGYADNRAFIRPRILPYLKPAAAHKALQRVKEYWSNYLGKLNVETPEKEMNLFVNTWNQYQCKTTFNWSRFVSLYQNGLGRGMGIRDSSQDTLGVMHTIPSEARTLAEKLLKCQFTDGRILHEFYPLTGEAGRGDAPIKKFDWYSDDHLWLILSVTAYIKETGDSGFLRTKILYNDKKSSGTVLEHLDKALEFTANHRGPRGLALAGRADWNDTLNLDMGKGLAESVFTSQLYCKALLDMIDLFRFLKKSDGVKKYECMFEEMKRAINQNAWDGEWYVRAYDDWKKPLGSKSCRFGKIFINSQSWAVMGGVADKTRSEKCMKSVEKHLNTKYGVVAMWPAYTRWDSTKGGITTYPPGAKENGGIFTHTNPWVMIAETLQGNGDKAFMYYKQVVPAYRNEDADLLEVEPYVYPQNVLGKEHVQFGIGRNSWLTGAASWNMVAASQYILGIRPDYDRLVVDPCIPKNWDGFKATRVFRGATYEIEVKNPDHVCKGIKQILVDGKPADAIRIFSKGSKHKVTVVLG